MSGDETSANPGGDRKARFLDLLAMTIAESEAAGIGHATSLRAMLEEVRADSVGGTLVPAGTPAGSDRPGAAGDRFEIQGVLGRGGMGEVHHARDRDLRRSVAVKTLKDPGVPDRIRRFIEEAQVTGQLEHPNIVPVHELCIDERNDRAIELDPGWAVPWFQRGVARHRSGAFGTAIEDYSMALSIDPELAPARYCRGAARAEIEDWRRASEDFTAVLERVTDDVPALAGRAAARAMLGDVEGTSRDLERLDPGELPLTARLHVARVRAVREEWDEAVRQCDLALREDPRSGAALMIRGDALLEANRFEEALRDFEAVVRIGPESPRSLTALGVARILSNDGAGAEKALDGALRLDPRWWPAWRRLSELRGAQCRWHESRHASSEAIRWAPQGMRPALAIELEVRLGIEGERPWGPEQAIGEPDVPVAGDFPTAWAPLEPDAGEEWLLVDFERSVRVAGLKVHESCNPGCIVRLSSVGEGDREVILWQEEPQGSIVGPSSVELDGRIETARVKIYLDTRRVSGPNEIDAFELVGADGSRQWAVGASASSHFAR